MDKETIDKCNFKDGDYLCGHHYGNYTFYLIYKEVKYDMLLCGYLAYIPDKGEFYYKEANMRLADIDEIRLALSSEVAFLNKTLQDQYLLMHLPYHYQYLLQKWDSEKKVLKSTYTPERGDICIFWNYAKPLAKIGMFTQMSKDNFVDNSDLQWKSCVPYNEELYKKMINFQK